MPLFDVAPLSKLLASEAQGGRVSGVRSPSTPGAASPGECIDVLQVSIIDFIVCALVVPRLATRMGGMADQDKPPEFDSPYLGDTNYPPLKIEIARALR